MIEAPSFVGTFHKTGTVLMKSILQGAQAEGVISLWCVETEPRPERFDVGFAEHCHFWPQDMKGQHRGVVIIRDPRDVIISGAHYHAVSQETWLNAPEERFGGLSYRQAIVALDSDDDKFLFEVNHAGGETIRHMQAFPTSKPDFLPCRYEDLVQDIRLITFAALFSHLGFEADRLACLLQIARANSLFAGARSAHVRDGSAGQWRRLRHSSFLSHFSERYDPLALQLGYGSTVPPQPDIRV